jgi:hypothetical protein
MLATLDYPHLPYLIENSDPLAAQYLVVIVEQLRNSTFGIITIFVEHYDRDLEEKRPFGTIWDTLNYREEQIKLIPAQSLSNTRRLRPEDFRGNELGKFCRGALMMLNGRDKGMISFVQPKELLDENKRKLKAFSGAFLFWECPECAYKIRYHVANSATSNIHSTDEVREHPGLDVQYRSSFLAKCHLYSPLSEKTSSSSTLSSSPSGRRDSYVLTNTATTTTAINFSTTRYGCIFCAARGADLERGETAFVSNKDLAEHIAYEHTRPLPPSLLLHRFFVAIDGKMIDERRRWELNLLNV